MDTELEAALASVAWDTLEHAYGEASDVPEMVRGLRDAETALDAMRGLWSSVLHQGFVCPATGPTIRVLGILLGDPGVAGRAETVGLLAGAAKAVATASAAGGDGSDPVTDEVRRALGDAVCRVLPVLDDPSGAARASVGALVAVLSDPPVDVLAGLRARLAVETDPEVVCALAGALQLHGGLSAAERDLVVAAGTGPAFAAAWSAVRGGAAPDSADYRRCAELWDAGRDGLAPLWIDSSEAIQLLVSARGQEVLPLFDALAAQPATGAEAVAGYLLLAMSSRAATPPVADRLIGLARQVSSGRLPGPDAPTEPDGAVTLRRAVVLALAQVVPGLGSDQATRVCDLLVELSGSVHADQDLRADAAVGLFLAGDDRWRALAAAAQRATSGEVRAHVARPDLGIDQVERMALPWAMVVAGMAPAGMDAPLAATIGSAPEVTASWARVLPGVPGAELVAAESLLAALPKAPDQVIGLLVARKATTSVPALRELAIDGPDHTRLSALVAAWALSGDPADAARLDAAAPGVRPVATAYRWWVTYPTPGLEEFRRRVLTEQVTDRVDNREVLLAVVADLAPLVGVGTVWAAATAPLRCRTLVPAFLGGVDVHIPVSLVLVDESPERRNELSGLLADRLGTGGMTGSGPGGRSARWSPAWKVCGGLMPCRRRRSSPEHSDCSPRVTGPARDWSTWSSLPPRRPCCGPRP
jgi:hypothetical protein